MVNCLLTWLCALEFPKCHWTDRRLRCERPRPQSLDARAIDDVTLRTDHLRRPCSTASDASQTAPRHLRSTSRRAPRRSRGIQSAHESPYASTTNAGSWCRRTNARMDGFLFDRGALPPNGQRFISGRLSAGRRGTKTWHDVSRRANRPLPQQRRRPPGASARHAAARSRLPTHRW